MIETKSGMLVSRCPRASHHPAKMNQMTLPTIEGAPSSGRRTAVRPKGHSTYPAMRRAARPNGAVTISTKQIRAASKYPRDIQMPQKTSQRMFRTKSITFTPQTYRAAGRMSVHRG
jgi:hypothetical protein